MRPDRRDSTSQHLGEQQTGTAPAADPPEAFTAGLGRHQGLGEGIQQPLGHREVLATATLAGTAAASTRRQAMELSQVMQQPRTAGPRGGLPGLGPA